MELSLSIHLQDSKHYLILTVLGNPILVTVLVPNKADLETKRQVENEVFNSIFVVSLSI